MRIFQCSSTGRKGVWHITRGILTRSTIPQPNGTMQFMTSLCPHGTLRRNIDAAEFPHYVYDGTQHLCHVCVGRAYQAGKIVIPAECCS